MDDTTPLVMATAMSLYSYNVDPLTRAERLYVHFDGACMDMNDMVNLLQNRGEWWATELPTPTAKVYLQHAMRHYLEEAERRVAANLAFEKSIK
jgi:hypothetical protein